MSTETQTLLTGPQMRLGTRALQSQLGIRNVSVSEYGDILVGFGWSRNTKRPWEATMWIPGVRGCIYGEPAFNQVNFWMNSIRRKQEAGSLPNFLNDSPVKSSPFLRG